MKLGGPVLLLGALLLANCASAASTAKACEDKGFSCIAFWQREGEVAVISWVLVGVASCICSLSIFLLFLGLAELRGWFHCGLPCCQTLAKLHVCAAILCCAPLGLGIYVSVQQVWLGLLFAPLAFVLLLLHGTCVFAGRADGFVPGIDLPTRSLLTPQGTGQPDSAAARPPAEAMPNPFTATYGLLPGTNQYGYTIFINTQQEEAAGPYAGLPAASSGKQSARRP